MRTETMKGVLLATTIVVVASANSAAVSRTTTSTAEGVIEIREEDVDRVRPPPPVTIQRRRRQRRQLVDNRPETGTARTDEHTNHHRKHHPKTTLEPTARGAKLSMRTHAPQITPDDESSTVMSMSMSSSSQQHESNEDNSGSKSGKAKSDKSSKKSKKKEHINIDHVTTSPSSSSNGISSIHPTCASPLDRNCIVPVPVPVPIIDGSISNTITNATTLTWMGVNGCTPLTPCPPCTGDCDTDADCTSGASIATSEGGKGGGTVGVTQYTGACYKRSDGSTEQIPGCSVGGTGDIPGADYCYAKVISDISYYHPPDDDVDGNGTIPTTHTTAPTTTSTDNISPSPPTMTSVSPRPSIKNENGSYFIQSRIEVGSTSLGGWCIGGALSPDYYQLQMEECITIDDYYTNETVAGMTGINRRSWDDAYVTTRLEQMDQLWNMDTMGYIRSAFEYDRCMTVPMSSIIEQQQQQQQNTNSVVDGDSGSLIAKESPVEIGPCTSSTDRLSRFIYPKNANEFMNGAVPKLRLRGFENYCVTFLGFDGDGMIPKGAPVVLGICPESVTITGQDEDGSYGWDFVSEHDLGVDGSETGTTVAPTSVPLPLRYLGRDACNPITPCHECMGDCDTDDDCSSGLTCFEREKDEYTKVPGCGTGGPGDIPGADYCYNSTPDNSDAGDNGLDPSTLPLLRWLGSEGCSSLR